MIGIMGLNRVSIELDVRWRCVFGDGHWQRRCSIGKQLSKGALVGVSRRTQTRRLACHGWCLPSHVLLLKCQVEVGVKSTVCGGEW